MEIRRNEDLMSFQKGEIYWTNLDPTEGAEIQKKRPAVIVSNNVLNASSPVVVICPITDSTGKKSPIHILIEKGEGGLTKESIAHCGQVRTVDQSRLLEKIGNLNSKKMTEIGDGLKYVLL